MVEDTNSGVGPTQDGFASLDLLRVLRTPSMASIGQPSDPVVFESFKQPDFFDRSQYAPQLGSSYTQAHDDPQEMQSEDDFYVQFDVVFTGKKKAYVTAGYVRNINPDGAADSPIIDWMPTLNGVPLSNDPPPEITVAAGQVLYCEVKTDPKGLIIETPTIILGEPQETGTHYQPPQKSPLNGSLRYPISEFESFGDELLAIQKQQGGPIVVQPNLWEGRNIGGQREWYKERQNAGDYYEFRTVEQLDIDIEQEGLTPVAVLQPIPDGGEEDTIKVRFLTQKPDEEYGENDPGFGKAQIKVLETDGGAGVIIRGNDQKFNLTGAFLTSLPVSDGLITGEPTTEAFGMNQTIEIIDGCGTQVHTLTFEKGLLKAYDLVYTVTP
jgi:hypothetical protein